MSDINNFLKFWFDKCHALICQFLSFITIFFLIGFAFQVLPNNVLSVFNYCLTWVAVVIGLMLSSFVMTRSSEHGEGIEMETALTLCSLVLMSFCYLGYAIQLSFNEEGAARLFGFLSALTTANLFNIITIVSFITIAYLFFSKTESKDEVKRLNKMIEDIRKAMLEEINFRLKDQIKQ